MTHWNLWKQLISLQINVYMNAGKKQKRCGECMDYTSLNCNKCKFYLDNPKLGGTGKKKQACILWRWSRMGSLQSKLRSKTVVNSQYKPTPSYTRKPLAAAFSWIPGTRLHAQVRLRLVSTKLLLELSDAPPVNNADALRSHQISCYSNEEIAHCRLNYLS